VRRRSGSEVGRHIWDESSRRGTHHRPVGGSTLGTGARCRLGEARVGEEAIGVVGGG
jgi:hypothetical protein